jgi:hypothetical protein
MSKPTPSRARRARLIAGAFVGSVLALGVTAGSASASEPKPAVKQVQVVDGEGDTPPDVLPFGDPLVSASNQRGGRWT